MESGETEWSALAPGSKSEVDSMVEDYQKQDSSSFIGSQSEQMYDESQLGGEDDYMNSLGLYDGYDSYNESGGASSENEDNQEGSLLPHSYQQARGGLLGRPRGHRYLNGKDGMATCERCGAVGVKHAFYSKSKRFCSLSCSRSFATSQREGKPMTKSVSPPTSKKGRPGGGRKSMTKSPSQSSQKSNIKSESKPFDWGPYLIASAAQAAPVSCFKHASMSDSWDQMVVGIKVEVINFDCDLPYTVYWTASVVKVAGYMSLMRYEGFGNDSSHDFWISLVSPDVHSVGWCATIGKPLVPPCTIQSKYSDWKDFLIKRLTGAMTLPRNFYDKFTECIDEHKLKRGMKIEVVDKMCVSAMRVAIIEAIVGGRLRLTYADSKDEGEEFWCHMRSPLIHPVGWAQTVGHKLHSSQEYRNACLSKIAMQKYSEDDTSPDMLPKVKEAPHSMNFQVGMKLEAIDPLNLSAICVATVMKVLKNNYLMIGIDGSMAESGSDWFCYHSSSPCIFPVGFCEINSIDLAPPRGYKGVFKWFDYLKHTKSVAAPVKLFDKEIPKHGFRPGMKLEAVDLMEPRLICVATVTRIVGRLLRIHFDGWDNEYDQWVDCQSPDIYPVGWCQIMNYTLEGPRIKENMAPATLIQKKKKTKNQIYKGPRKKRKSKPPPGKPGFRFFPGSLLESNREAEHLSGTRPPHVPLPPEAVAATLRPLLDPEVPSAKKVKWEHENYTSSPMDASFPSSVFTSIASAKTQEQERLPVLNSSDQRKGSASNLPGSIFGIAEKNDYSTRSPSVVSSQTIKAQSSGQSTHTADSVNNNSPGGSTSDSIGRIAAIKAEKKEVFAHSPLEVSGQQHHHHGMADNMTSPSSISSVFPSLSLDGSTGHVSLASGQDAVLSLTQELQSIPPKQWSVSDICLFLRINDCAAYTDAFVKKGINGQQFLDLTPEQIISLAGTKVGPSLRITQLLQQLKTYSDGKAIPASPGRMSVDAE
ncbi:hypothetical protein C0Q70_05737 [Pomacea canaliculata]|uniref:FCS-type domain-containing protein n=1 Tax=Pomacea canaliculata TaxID=400727 RepID=A0A2T7PM42_POMCA|nr:MBT domain-containing protein 1-like isoform X2 [Pomacea canaliculata]PVD34462.1 hypothetical protein C0Q70_05737 [Pomacea canaliculata]